MADFQISFRSWLKLDPELMAMAGGHIEFIKRPEGAGNLGITLQTTINDKPDHFSGAQELRLSTIQFDAWGTEPLQVHLTAERAIQRARLLTVHEGVKFLRFSVSGPIGTGAQDDGIFIYRSMVIFNLWHVET
jgi:hypothetical protein